MVQENRKILMNQIILLLLSTLFIFFTLARSSDSQEHLQKKSIFWERSFFPLAVWLQPPENAEAYRELGINLYVGLWQGPTAAQLLTLKKAGMPVICHQNTVGLNDENRDIIVGWMQIDEPDNKQKRENGWGYDPPVSPLEIISRFTIIRGNDSTRPVLLNLGQGVAWDQWKGRGTRENHPEDYSEYIKGGDILSFDIYPVTHGSPEVQGKLEYIARGVGRLKNLVSHQQRVWNIIGVSRISNPLVKPTPDQVRSQVWMSIIHGSQGIIYFVHQFKPDFIEASLLHDMEMQKEVKRLNRRIIDLAPVLNSPNTDDILVIVTDSSEAAVAAVSKRHKSSLYLLAVNMQDTAQSAKFELRASVLNQQAEVIDEHRTVSVQDGVLQDHFAPYEPHLYRLDICPR
jgi:hypothetical protein